jgi:GH18 family chitinase
MDFISVMTYDLHGPWEKFTGHNSPLKARRDESGADRYLNIVSRVKYSESYKGIKAYYASPSLFKM